MLIPSKMLNDRLRSTSLSRRVNANSQLDKLFGKTLPKLIKKGEC